MTNSIHRSTQTCIEHSLECLLQFLMMMMMMMMMMIIIIIIIIIIFIVQPVPGYMAQNAYQFNIKFNVFI